MNTIPGQPYEATATFYNDAGQLYDPFEVIFTVTVQRFGPAVVIFTAKVGVDPAAIRLSTGTYRYTWNPTRKGNWQTTADAFDNQGRQIGAATATIAIASRPAPAPAP